MGGKPMSVIFKKVAVTKQWKWNSLHQNETSVVTWANYALCPCPISI